MRIVGDLYKADSSSNVIMAPEFTNDKSSNGRFEYIAQCLARDKHNVLSLDFSGCGESDDDSLTVSKQIDDLRMAIAFAKSLGHTQFALWGHSLGGRICVQAYLPEIRTMVLTGAPLGAMQYRWEEYFSPEQMHELAQTGKITQQCLHGPRREIIIDEQMLKDFADFDQQRILSQVKCPVLVINGDGDDEERLLKDVCEQAMRYLPDGSQHEVIHGACHNFWRYLDRAVDLGLDWLSQKLY